jgi:hypothetical protein
LTDCASADGQEDVSLHQKWNRFQDSQGLWTMFENAGVMLEMADYTARNNDSPDLELLSALRTEAMQIRILVLEVFAEYAIGSLTETINNTALQAESAYAEMAIRLTELLEANAPDALPAFLAAM